MRSPLKTSTPTTTTHPNNNNNAARAAARGTLWSILFKVFSFGLTQLVVLRLVDPAAYGTASVPLDLLLSFTLFVSREGFRLVLPTTKMEQEWNVRNALLSVPVNTVVVVIAMALLLMRHTSSLNTELQEDDDDPEAAHYYYRTAGLLYCLAAWIEGLAEPCILWCLRQLETTRKTSAEGLATLVKSLTLVVGLSRINHMMQQPPPPQQQQQQQQELYNNNNNNITTSPLIIFGIAQVLYAVTLTTYMYLTTSWSLMLSSSSSKSTTTPSSSTTTATTRKLNNNNNNTLLLVFFFTLQGILKHALTEGDRIVLSYLSDGYHQGLYAMGSAYGGMAARLLLQPLEEHGRLLWSRTTSANTNSNATTTNTTLFKSYTSLTKLVVYVGLLFATVAVNYTSVLLRLVAGQKWSDANHHTNNEESGHDVLSAFCVYTACLAWNGMTEAFVYAVAQCGADVGRLGVAHVAVGAVFAVLAPLLIARHGTVGLVAANGACMMLRSMYSLHVAVLYFTKHKHHEKEQQQRKKKDDNDDGRRNKPSSWSDYYNMWRRLLSHMVPPPAVLAAFAGAFGVTRLSLQRLQQQLELLQVSSTRQWLWWASQHVAVGIASVLIVGVVTVPCEREFRRSLRDMFREKQE